MSNHSERKHIKIEGTEMGKIDFPTDNPSLQTMLLHIFELHSSGPMVTALLSRSSNPGTLHCVLTCRQENFSLQYLSPPRCRDVAKVLNRRECSNDKRVFGPKAHFSVPLAH